MNTPAPVMREAIIDAALAAIRTTLITKTKPACIDGYFFQSPTYHVITPDPHEGHLTVLLRNYPALGEDTHFTIAHTPPTTPSRHPPTLTLHPLAFAWRSPLLPCVYGLCAAC